MAYETFGEWLVRHNVTAYAFAKQFGLNPRRVQRWACGEVDNVLLPVVMRLIDTIGAMKREGP